MSAATAAIWAPPSPRARSRVALMFLGIVIVCQLGLLFPALAGLRIAWRMGAFLTSLALLALVPGRTRRFAPTVAAIWVLALLALEIFHPDSNSWLAAIAQFAIYLATLAPLFWLSRLWIDQRGFRAAILLMWLFYCSSAAVGLLQVYFPGHFQPALSPVVEAMGAFVAGLKITLPNGHVVFRPMGLTDTPGGAGLAGMWAILFGLGLLFSERSLLVRIASLFGMIIGLMCIYFSQVREQLVVVVVWVVALAALLLWRRMWKRAAALLLLLVAIAALSYAFTLSLGGRGIFQRLQTLTTAPSEAYAASRGRFLTQTLTSDLPHYPLGAGMGRWGMMNYYFGNDAAPAARQRLYVEIQLTGWVFDGGLPLLLLYLTMIGLAMLGLYDVARRPGPLRLWAVIMLAFDIGMIAMAFDYTSFVGDSGLQFWFLNALLLTAAASLRAAPATSATALPPRAFGV